MNNDIPHLPIYMDYSATTPIDPRVVDKMIPYLREQFGKRVQRSVHARSATALGLAIQADAQAGYILREKFTRLLTLLERNRCARATEQTGARE